MASTKPFRPTPGVEDARTPKRPRPEAPPSASQSSAAPLRVQLNPADCNLDFNIEQTGLQGHALHDKGFAYCWSGARATVGITGGKYCFGCKVISEQVVDMADTPPDQQHVTRVGISRGDEPVGNLGETMHSFGFGGTGKFSSAGKFLDYGGRFGVGDMIVCAVNLESKPLASIGFSKNGKWLGTAKQFDAGAMGLCMVGNPLANRPWESALFPHVLLKNVVVQLQFSIEDGLIPEEGYKPWNSALGDGNALIGPSFSSPKECEVLMMVGLPASGKTTWAEKWEKEHPEKRYILLGTNLALEQMKVPGLLRKQNYGERFDRLMDRATGIFNTLLARAAKTPRNYILDQTNVYRSARNRKLKPFVNYRKIAVVAFPTPDELKARADNRFKEMGKEVPAEAVNEMLANYVLPMTKDMPGSTEFFDEVIFTELGRGEAQRYLDEMKRELKSSNMNAKRDFSPYSRENSVQSFACPSAEKKEAASVASGHWSTSQPPALHPDRDILNHIQVNPTYPGSGSFGGPQRMGDTNISVPSNSPYGYTKYGRSSLHRDEPDPYGPYSGSDPYRGSISESFIPMGDTRQTYGSTDAIRRPNFESRGSIGISDYGYSSTLPSYSSPGLYVRDPGLTVHQADRQAARDPSYEWRSPIQNPYCTTRDLPPYSSPGGYIRDPGVPQFDRQATRDPPYEWHSPLQNTYGSPYATPPPRPPSGVRPPLNNPPGSQYR